MDLSANAAVVEDPNHLESQAALLPFAERPFFFFFFSTGCQVIILAGLFELIRDLSAAGFHA